MQTLDSTQPGVGATAPAPSPFVLRRVTRPVAVGAVTIGGTAPVVVQSMINEDTLDTPGAVRAIRDLHRAGCELVRVTVPSVAHARALERIRKTLEDTYLPVPLVADVHHDGGPIALEVARHVDKVRINPGLFVFRRTQLGDYTAEDIAHAREQIRADLAPLVEVLGAQGKAMRIGVNHGSLSERMLYTHGDTPEGMVYSAIEFVEICEEMGFRNLVISLKASRVQVMIAAYRLAAKLMDERGMNYPFHLGVTEAGDGEYGRIKSTAGIATLLADGIGDTIRVSLTEDPIKEIPVCYGILQALGLRRTMVEYVACPSCGRTLFNLESVLHQVRSATQHLTGLNIAVMGCIVNGPGEMADADYGYVGRTPGIIALYRGREEIKKVPESEGVAELIALIKNDGRWVEPSPA